MYICNVYMYIFVIQTSKMALSISTKLADICLLFVPVWNDKIRFRPVPIQ